MATRMTYEQNTTTPQGIEATCTIVPTDFLSIDDTCDGALWVGCRGISVNGVSLSRDDVIAITMFLVDWLGRTSSKTEKR